MKKFILFFLLSSISKGGISQINPAGLTLDLDGKLRLIGFWEAANDEDRTITSDSVFFTAQTLEGKQLSEVRDFEFLMSHGFEILPAANPDETRSEIRDPNDTTSYTSSYPSYFPYFIPILFDTTLLYIPIDTNGITKHPLIPKLFEDEIVFTGTMDEKEIQEAKMLLKEYVLKQSGKDIDYDLFYALRDKLSEEDSVVEQKAYYDYLVSKVVFNEYEKDKLTGSMSYYYLSGGIENDSILYDKNGKIIYFSRESVGVTITKIYVNYDKKQRVSKIKTHKYDYNSQYFDACPNCLNRYMSEEQLFTYTKKGLISGMTTKYQWGKETPSENTVELRYGKNINKYRKGNK